jgi:hypothetical protein
MQTDEVRWPKITGGRTPARKRQARTSVGRANRVTTICDHEPAFCAATDQQQEAKPNSPEVRPRQPSPSSKKEDEQHDHQDGVTVCPVA